jgi:hypothetical protein
MIIKHYKEKFPHAYNDTHSPTRIPIFSSLPHREYSPFIKNDEENLYKENINFMMRLNPFFLVTVL